VGAPNSDPVPVNQPRRLDPVLTAIVLLAALIGALVVSKARNWAVMTDELLYTEMARSISHSILPLAQVRGQSVPINQVLFPTLIAPLVGAFSMASAYPWIAALNGVIFATAAIPAYMLTSHITQNRTAARWVALCTVITPWLAFASKALPDSAAYVAVLWAAYALVRTAGKSERPLKGDLLTLLAIAAAYLVRNQFLLLVGVWIAAVVLIRVSETLADGGWRAIPRALLRLPRDRPIPVIAFVLVVLIVEFQPAWLLGAYTITTTSTRGGAAPSGLVHAIFNHASVIALGVAGVPLILGLPWLCSALGRVRERAQNDAAIVFLLLTGAILFVSASFDVRFTESDRVIERYVFYFAPLLFVAMAAFFSDPPKNLIAFAVPAIIGLLILNVNQPYGADSQLALQINHAFSPIQVALIEYQKVAEAIGTSIFGLMAVITILVGGISWWLIDSGRGSIAMSGSFALVAALLLVSTVYTVPKVVKLQNTLVSKIYGDRTAEQKSWIDEATGGEPASLAFSVRTNTSGSRKLDAQDRISNWWDLAFWNQSISAVYLPLRGDLFGHNPFPGAAYTMLPNWETGALKRAKDDHSRYLIQADSDPNFAPIAFQYPWMQNGFALYDTGKHATAAWATRGLTAGGWVPRVGGVTLRVWAAQDVAGPSDVKVKVTMSTTRRPPMLTGFGVRGMKAATFTMRGRETIITWRATIPHGGHDDFRLLRGDGNAHVDSIVVTQPERAFPGQI
jgi:hypothetical protein